MAEYDPGYDPPSWWHAKAKRIIETEWNGRRPELAERASAAAGREKPWDVSRISKYLNGQNSTLKLTIGIAKAIGIPPPIFEARSWDEAESLHQRSKLYDGANIDERANPDQKAKIAAISHALDSAVEVAMDQTRPVRLPDEGSPRGPGHRRASARRQKASRS